MSSLGPTFPSLLTVILHLALLGFWYFPVSSQVISSAKRSWEVSIKKHNSWSQPTGTELLTCTDGNSSAFAMRSLSLKKVLFSLKACHFCLYNRGPTLLLTVLGWSGVWWSSSSAESLEIATSSSFGRLKVLDRSKKAVDPAAMKTSSGYLKKEKYKINTL